MGAKELVRDTFRKRQISRPPFIPFVGSYLAKVDQLSMQEVLSDASLMYQALRNTQQLFQYDGVVVPLDTTLEAEAFGVEIQWLDAERPTILQHLAVEDALLGDVEHWTKQGRIPVFLEAVERFVKVHGREIPIFATVSGPLTIWHHVYGTESRKSNDQSTERLSNLPHMEVIHQAVIRLCRAYAELKVDGVIVNERDVRWKMESLDQIHDLYKPIFNVLRFYNTPGILRLPQDVSFISQFSLLGADAVICSDPSLPGVVGLEVHSEFWNSTDDRLQEFAAAVRKRGLKGVFLTTEEPLNEGTVELLQLQDKISSICEEHSWR